MRTLFHSITAGALVSLLLGAGCDIQSDRPSTDVTAASGAITTGTSYTVVAQSSGKCLDVTNVSTADGAGIQQWSCHGGPNQMWQLRNVGGANWEIVSANSNKCLEVAGASTANGARVDQATCNGQSNARWTLSNSGGNGPTQVRSASSGKCLDVTAVSSADGAPMQQWSCGGGANQKFTFKPTAAGGGGSGGSSGGAGGSSGGGTGCDTPGLVWHSGNKTNFTSYPEPGSEECIKFSGCQFEGLFAGCPDKRPLSWVMSHNIVAAFPNFNALALHDLCLRSSNNKTIVVTVLDTCGDNDCDGCCTQNRGDAEALIDVESFTDARWGVPDGRIQWADLGPTKGGGCQ